MEQKQKCSFSPLSVCLCLHILIRLILCDFIFLNVLSSLAPTPYLTIKFRRKALNRCVDYSTLWKI